MRSRSRKASHNAPAGTFARRYIVVVDDDAGTREILEHALKCTGVLFPTTVATNALAGYVSGRSSSQAPLSQLYFVPSHAQFSSISQSRWVFCGAVES